MRYVPEIARFIQVTSYGRYHGILTRRGQRQATYTAVLSTNAEFFDPKAMQLHTACSIFFFLPASGT